jgi:hypothetical protein
MISAGRWRLCLLNFYRVLCSEKVYRWNLCPYACIVYFQLSRNHLIAAGQGSKPARISASRYRGEDHTHGGNKVQNFDASKSITRYLYAYLDPDRRIHMMIVVGVRDCGAMHQEAPRAPFRAGAPGRACRFLEI